MKNNSYKKMYPMDKFAKHYYCKHARRNQIRSDKAILKSKVRVYNKEEIRKETLRYEQEKRESY